MKTISTISKESGVPRKTLHSRMFKLGNVVKKGNAYFLNIHQEQEILRAKRNRVFKEKLPSEVMIYDFKCRYPILSNEELSITLGVSESYINNIFSKEFLIIESKMNNL